MKGKLSSLRPEVLLKAVDTSYCFAIRLIYACYTLCGETQSLLERIITSFSTFTQFAINNRNTSKGTQNSKIHIFPPVFVVVLVFQLTSSKCNINNFKKNCLI